MRNLKSDLRRPGSPIRCALIFLLAYGLTSGLSWAAQSADAVDAPEPEASAPAAPAAPPPPVETMKFSQQQTIVQPSEIRIGPGISCRMDETVLVCDLARPAPAPTEAAQ